MNRIDIITDNPKQTMEIVLEDGTSFQLDIRYVDNQSGWFYSITYGDFELLNRRVVNSPNMIRMFRTVIPFGLSCIVNDGQEPVFIEDFKNGRAKLYTLNEEDVALAETVVARVD